MPDLDRQRQSPGQRPALLVVDMINGFTDPACPLGSEAESVVAANQRLLEAFRQRALPVLFTTVVYRDPGQAPVFRARLPDLDVLQPGSEWIRVDSRLNRRPSEPLVEKQYASGFFGTDMKDQLARHGADSLVVTGLTTSGCVRATVVDGLQHDYRVFVPHEAVGDRNSRAHESNLFDMDAKYADVLSVDELLEAINDGRPTDSNGEQ